MLEFMDYIQQAFYEGSHWNYENSYSQLTATARALLDFDTPRGLRLNLSSLSSPNFATSYAIGSVGLVDGSLSYLYTSLPLRTTSQSGNVDLHNVIRGYRQIQELRRKEESWMWERWQGGRRIDKRDTLLYGRLYLPQSTLEGLYLRRISPTQQLKLSVVSDSRLRNGGTVLALHQYDVGKYNAESLYSTDGGLIGFRGLYNFGPDPRKETTEQPPRMDDRFYGRFSAGAEMYYGSLNKSGGVSFGGRFATLPAHKGTPLTATLTLNPLMGNVSTTYAVKAGENLALCSKFDFNVYSYESDLMLGFELWRMKGRSEPRRERSIAAKLEWRADTIEEKATPEPEQVMGVLKARMDQNWKIGLLWEGRVKELLFTLGTSIDMKRRDQPFRVLGLELQYSS
ncbi:Mitochondrial distribution and morphology protein 10 [Venustampulla echinocandica]|uniref:Mitochondrial distribution and morphology protein 10 n=1 Tax=Venustampulla echinocandica TaxID=2656787 RepID=A0A370TVV0_9HELO|nr:Mitochondrial distribution and morphology protein 10 [Venustampulla echinocandica]RDL39639.1 Mitochondrial distribution and morphology protein 10 [Venustampulla echinocandica]